MRQILLYGYLLISALACKPAPAKLSPHTIRENNVALAQLFDYYYQGRMRLFPLEATQNGDDRYNDLLPVDFTDSYRDTLRSFYTRCRIGIDSFDSATLNEQDRLSYAIFKWELGTRLEGLDYPSNKFPFNQFNGLPLTLGQLGSGQSFQPFRNLKDHQDWLLRARAFGPWADSAIVYFRKGIAAGWVLPKTLVLKMIPQLDAMVSGRAEDNLFYGPVGLLSANPDTAIVKKLTREYIALIRETIIPSYKKLANVLKEEYLPRARASSGLSGLPGGAAYYTYLVRDQTTTRETPEEIYQTGFNEVTRIRAIMDSVRQAVGFKGDLAAFFTYLKTDKKFMPYKHPAEVLAAFEAIYKRIQPRLHEYFDHTPKTGFEIRQTEAFRAASASAEYNQGSPDGKRPGIFYVPILDARRFNTTSGMESLFLHEAIPGHHYQISLQQEDSLLPEFRRFGGNNAYIEGWALYCESLGKELGLYTDPYQYMGALGDEIHRAVRLVVDVAIHTRSMTRGTAIKYMMDNEPISEAGATAEIERYMAFPAQALGYKIGAMKIRALRNKCRLELGTRFRIAAFHDEILKDGAMPLEVLEKKMDAWADQQK